MLDNCLYPIMYIHTHAETQSDTERHRATGANREKKHNSTKQILFPWLLFSIVYSSSIPRIIDACSILWALMFCWIILCLGSWSLRPVCMRVKCVQTTILATDIIELD